MSIETTCPGCKSLFQLPDDLAGETVRCEACGGTFEVPASEPIPTVEPIDDEAKADVVLATLVDPLPEATPPPPLLARAAPDRPPSVLVTLVLMVLFVLGMAGVGAFATFWIVTHLGPAISTAQPANR